ncbi:MAG: hypothetical protein LC798_21395 [Chloroflexi bacterium]|nr:hypothetical protein [Chloroflexota bacterium]
MDTDLLDYVEGTCDATTADSIASHLAGCLLCRIKRQRLSGAPPMELADVRHVVTPDFGVIDVAPADAKAPQPGELWLTSSDEATMVLVTGVRADDAGVVVVPVTLDVDVADRRVLILDESASPLSVPLAIYEDLTVSLPTRALAERVAPLRQVDLLSLSDQDEGVARGSPIESHADSRLEIRQYLVDRLISLDPHDAAQDDQPGESGHASRLALLQDELLFRRGPNCDVQELTTLPPGAGTPSDWTGLARVIDFRVRVIVIETPSGLQDDSDFSAAQALVVRLDASSLAVCTPNTDTADIYDAPALFRAFQLPEGTRSSDPLISGLWLPDAVAKYLDQKRPVVSVVMASTRHAPRVHAADVLAHEVISAVDATSKRASKLGPAKGEGYLRLPAWRSELADVLKRALEPEFDPQWITDAIGGEDR